MNDKDLDKLLRESGHEIRVLSAESGTPRETIRKAVSRGLNAEPVISQGRPRTAAVSFGLSFARIALIAGAGFALFVSVFGPSYLVPKTSSNVQVAMNNKQPVPSARRGSSGSKTQDEIGQAYSQLQNAVSSYEDGGDEDSEDEQDSADLPLVEAQIQFPDYESLAVQSPEIFNVEESEYESDSLIDS